MLDKSKVATLVKMKGPMPQMPVKKPAAPPAGHPAAGMKPGAPPAPQQHSLDDMTPQELAQLVEEAAQEAEAGQDHEIEDNLVDYMHGDQSAPPAWATDHDLWQKAADAVGLGGADDQKYDEPYAVVAYLYKKLGGQMQPAAAHDAGAEGHADPAAQHPAAKPPAPGAKPGAPPPAAGAKPPMGSKPPMGAKPGMPPAKPAAPAAKPPAAPPGKGAPSAAGAKPAVGNEGAGAGADAGGQLKQMLDQAAQQAQSQPDPAIMQKLQAEPPQEGQPPSWATDHDKWTKAEAAVKPHWAEYPDPWVVVAHVYKGMGGGVQ